MFLLHNFRLVAEDQFSLGYNNRAFQYNDGLFDTLIMADGQIRFLPDHLERMQQALQLLQIDTPAELQQPAVMAPMLRQLAEQNHISTNPVRVKVHIWRAPGGLFTPEQNTAETLITAQPQAKLSKIIPRADFAATVCNTFSPLTFFKGPLAAQYVLASLEKKQKQLDELILLDGRGYISEGLTANIFWITDNTLYTPALTTGCVAGIARKNILRVSAAAGIKVAEGIFLPGDLLTAEVVFTSNVTGLRPIRFIRAKEFATEHPLLTLLQTRVFG